MGNRKNDFTLNLDALEKRQRDRDICDAQLSEQAGREKSWLSKIKHRTNGPKVKKSDAQRLADTLGCTLQDIGKADEKAWNPIWVECEEAARGRLEKLLPQNAELVAYILEFLESASAEQKNNLRAYIYEDTQLMRKKF